MHVKRFLHKLLRSAIHKKRIQTLAEVVISAINTKELVLTKLGRALSDKIQERSGIQKVNRLLGNKNLLGETECISSKLAALLIGNKKKAEIIVDWSKYPNSEDGILRAALAMEGRALTVYEERHAFKKMGNKKVQSDFLRVLKRVLPPHCEALIVTDAGFHNAWFKEVEKLGWQYIGRVRGLKTYKSAGQAVYFSCKKLFKRAQAKSQYLGEITLTQKNPLQSHAYLVKKPLKGRKKYTKKGKVSRHKDSKSYSRAQREPWLLVSSLKGRYAAKKVQAAYKKRMTIEEAFRDLKSSRYGFGLAEGRTLKPERRAILLLIAMLASLIAWLTGYVGERLNLHYHYQSNSIKHRRVISLFYLGCQLIRKNIPIRLTCLWDAIAALKSEAIYG